MRQNERKNKLVDYIKRNFKKGYTPDSLKYALLKQGYLRIEIDEALERAHKEIGEEVPLITEKPKITHEIVEEVVPEPQKSWYKRLFGID